MGGSSRLRFAVRDGKLLERLSSLARKNFDADMALQPDGGGRPQPFCDLYGRDACLPVAREMLEEGDW